MTLIARIAVAVLAFGQLLVTLPLAAQTPSAPTGVPAGADRKSDAPTGAGKPDEGPLAPLEWLAGCWSGSVNQRDFREHWMPLLGDRLLGISHTTMNGKTLDFEFLRMEPRSDGVYYVILPSDKLETNAFRLADTKTDGKNTLYPFSDPAREFPQRIVYRRASEGWLYVTVEGKVAGQDKQVIYPMRRIDCQTGEIVSK